MDIITRPGAAASPERIALSPDEAAYLVGISRSRVYELMAAGELRSVKIGRSRRIPRQALLDYIEALDSGNVA